MVLSMDIDRTKLFIAAEDFFSLHGSGIMRLNADAAIAICDTAAKYSLIILRVEGGIWHNPGFEQRLDCIWDGAIPPVPSKMAEENNVWAKEFIEQERAVHDVFILTAVPLDRLVE
jgi:hypothetical protein